MKNEPCYCLTPVPGILAFQIHGGSTAIVRYKGIAITELSAAKGK
jgi:hypothetical protein